MSPSPILRRGFSLIELMISTAAGLAIILVAMAGYRSAASAMTVAIRMADGTALIAAGMERAYDESDHWTYYDDPSANTTLYPERQALRHSYVQPGNFLAMYKPCSLSPSGNDVMLNSRTVTGYTFGLPFSPLSLTWNSASRQLYGGRTIHNPSGWLRDGDASSGGDNEDEAWAISAANPMTWWTGNLQSGLGLPSRKNFNNIFGTPGYTGPYTPANSNNFTGDSWGTPSPSVLRKGYYAIFGISGYPGYDGVASGGSTSQYTAIIGNPLFLYQSNTSNLFPPAGTYPLSYGKVDFTISSDPNGPYGDLANGNTTPLRGWVFNQIRGIQNALGFYGMLDYLPAGMVPAYPIAETPSRPYAHGTTPSTAPPVNAADITDWDHFPAHLTYGYLGNVMGSATVHDGNIANLPLFNLCAAETLDNDGFDNRAIPTTDRLLYPGGFSVIPWCNEMDQFGSYPQAYPGIGNPVARPLVRPTSGYRDLVHYHRSFFSWGESNDFTNNAATLLNGASTSSRMPPSLTNFIRQTPMYYDLDANGLVRLQSKDWTMDDGFIDPGVMTRFQQRTTGTMRLSAMRPSEWPDVTVSVSHHLRMNKYINTVKVGYVDPVTGKTYDLRFSTMGTTLRGARRQRQLDNL